MIANAAAVVPRLKDGRVLVGERTRLARSWPGTLAFPGGGVEQLDAKLPLVDGANVPAQARSARACALRELGEETGLWMIARADGTRDDAAARRAVADHRGGRALHDALVTQGLALDDRALVPLTLWPVPSGRFAVQQFLLPLPDEPALVEPTTDELRSIRFESPGALRAAWRDGKVFLLSPIRRVVVGLALHEHDVRGAIRALSMPPSATERARLDLIEGVCVIAARTPTLPPATHTNAVLLGGAVGDAVLVDPATPYADERDRFDRQLDDALGARPLRAVVCTHHHHDHVGDVARTAQRLGAPVWAHEETAARVDFKIDRVLRDGDVIEVEPGLRFTALHTPGHAPGHLCLFDERTRLLIAGDMVAAVGSIIIDPDDGHMGRYIASLERLIALAPRGVIPSHGPLIVDGRARLEEQLAHRKKRQDAVEQCAASAAGGASVQDVVAAVYGADTPAAMLPLAARAVMAALAWGEERGRLARHGERWAAR